MSTLNISMPDTMRDYIEAQAEKGQYSTSEYVRHLIREDQKRQSEADQALLWELLAISAHELDEEDFADVTADDVIQQSRQRRTKS